MMNAGLGNRHAYHCVDAVSQDGGGVTCCRLCFLGPNHKLHLVKFCHCLESTRLSIHLPGGISHTAALESVRVRNACVLAEETLWMFLDQELGLSWLDLVDCGLELDVLVDCFFLEWSTAWGRTVP